MKKEALTLFLSSFCCFSVLAQKDNSKNRLDSLVGNIEYSLDEVQYQITSNERFKLYKTENFYHFLRLDTRTGVIDQIQWSLDTAKEYIVSLNSESFESYYGYKNGTFELYPTKNMYQFILLDKVNGRTWHVQWGLEPSERWIRRITSL